MEFFCDRGMCLNSQVLLRIQVVDDRSDLWIFTVPLIQNDRGWASSTLITEFWYLEDTLGPVLLVESPLLQGFSPPSLFLQYHYYSVASLLDSRKLLVLLRVLWFERLGVTWREGYRTQAYLSSIQYKNLNPYRFVADSFQMTLSRPKGPLS
jgi:hypothetical protein